MKSLILTGHSRPLTHLRFNLDGDMLFSCGKEGNLNCWLIHTHRRHGRYDLSGKMVTSCDVTLDSKLLLATCADYRFYVFNVATGTKIFMREEEGPVRFGQWNSRPGKQTKFLVYRDTFKSITPAISIYEESRADTGSAAYSCVARFETLGKRCIQVHWGPFDATLISGNEDGYIHQWDVQTGAELRKFQAHEATVTWMDFTADRLLMLTCSSDRKGKLWETSDFTLIKTYNTDRALNSCAISPCWDRETNPRPHVAFGGGQLAKDVTTTGAAEGKFEALIYHMIFGKLLGSLAMHFSPINCIAFSPDGSGIATGAEEGNLRYTFFDEEYNKLV